MKQNYFLFASLALGLALASCQNDVNEPILMDEVQNELTVTRADGINSISLEGDVEEMLASLNIRSSSITISGSGIIGGSATQKYEINFLDIPTGTRPVWVYNSSLLTEASITTDSTSIHLQTNGLTSGYDTSVMVYFYDKLDGSLDSYAIKYVGINGPHYNDCSIRVVRSSDGAEVYPSHTVSLEPNTYYYAYFSTTTGGSNMNLTWTFYDDVTLISSYGYTAYFQTGNINNCYLHVSGTMPTYGVNKNLLGIGLY